MTSTKHLLASTSPHRARLWAIVAVVVVGTASVVGAEVGAAPAAAPTPPAEVLAFVRRLGDDSFVNRQQAAQRLLEIGMPAKPALLAGLQDRDADVRRSCRRLLEDIGNADLRQRLAAFVADPDGKRPVRLAWWEHYREAIGHDRAARDLFIEMQRADGALLEIAEAGGPAAAEAMTVRYRQLFRQVHGAEGQQSPRKEPTLGQIAVLLFLSAETRINVPQELLNMFPWVNLVHMGHFSRALQEGPYKPAARRILGRQIALGPADPWMRNRWQFALQYDLKEGLASALAAIKTPKATAPDNAATGVEVVARLGGKPYAATLLPALEDTRECARTGRVVNGRHEQRVIEVRDVALVWLVAIADQDLAQYGMPEAKNYVENARKNPGMFGGHGAFGFWEQEKREAALKKWEAWVRAHPLPEPPAPPDIGKPPTAAPPAAKPAVETADHAGPSGLPLADRSRVQQLLRAQRLAQEQQFGDALALLGEILSADSDYAFQPDRGVPLYRRLKDEAERLIGRFPADERARFELQFGALARRRLNDAIEAGDWPAVDEVARSYFYTAAGSEAAYAAGLACRRAAQYLRAAHYFRRLEADAPRCDRFQPAVSLELAACYLRARMPQAAQATLVRLKARQTTNRIAVGGQERPLFATPEQAVPWLESIIGPERSGDDWPMPGGNPSWNAAVAECNPYLEATYRVPVGGKGLLDTLFAAARKRDIQRCSPPLPSLQPLVVGDRVVLRTATTLRAVSWTDGRLLWETPLDDPLERFLRVSGAGPLDDATTQIVAHGLSDRLWDDPTFGTVTSDGRYIFGVERLPFELGGPSQTLTVLPDGRRQIESGTTSWNLLTAYDCGTGKLKWELGGPPKTPGNPLAGSRFVGPPLPLGGQLFAVAECADQRQLLAIQPASGTVLYRLTLTVREESELDDETRKSLTRTSVRTAAALCASADEGLLVCRLDGDRYVGVDLAGQSVAWVHPAAEPTERSPRRGRLPFFAFARRSGTQDSPAAGWRQSAAMLADGRVLLTTQTQDQLVCLNLRDGAQQWAIPRRDGLFVVGVRDGIAIVVGRHVMWGVRLSDGKPAWPEGDVVYPGAAVAAGYGFLGANRFALPLSTGEVATFDVRTGRLVSRTRSSGSLVPGNLVCCRGQVLSLDAEQLCRFDSLAARKSQVTKTLQGNPADGDAQVAHAEVLLYDGQVAEALERLLQMAAGETSPRTRELLATAIGDGLRQAPERFLPVAARIEPLLDNPVVRGRLYREWANAQQRIGRPREAFDTYLKWADIETEPQRLDPISASVSVRTDRWIQARLAELWPAAAGHPHTPMARAVAARLTDDKLPQRLGFFGRLPPGIDARFRWARRITEPPRRLEAEQTFRQVLALGGSDQEPAATAALAAVLREPRPDLAVPFYTLLRGRLADTVCLDGKRGRELFEMLPAHDLLRRLGPAPWPAGEVKREWTKRLPNQPQPIKQMFPFFMGFGETNPRVTYDPQGPTILELDERSQPLWKLAVSQLKIDGNHMGYANWSEGRAVGGVLILAVGNRIAAIDRLADKGKVLWIQDSFTSGGANPRVQLRWNRRIQMLHMPRLFPGTAPQPLLATADYVCFEQNGKLVAVEPRTGTTLWTREDLGSDLDLFGDENRVFATAGGPEAVVLSAIDGRELGRRPVPELSQRVGVFGARLLTWEADQQTVKLALVDPWEQQPVWQRQFDPSAKGWLVDAAELGVLDAQGRLEIVRIADGQSAVKTSLDPAPRLEGVVVRRAANGYLVLTHCPQPAANQFISNLPGCVPVGGAAYGIQRDGKPSWKTEIPNQQFNPSQPAGLPLAVFLSWQQTWKAAPGGGMMGVDPQTRLLCLDPRNGRVLHNEGQPGYEQHYELAVDEKAHQLEVRTAQQSVKLTYLP
jgi:outer membrane protein assembly factor BamB